jgi:hypothetical protein
MDYSNTAVITGASSGIGSVYAHRLAERGRDLMLVARRADRLEKLALELRAKHGIAVEIMAADLTDPAELADLERRLEREPVAMLVNNAGAGGLGPTALRGVDAQDDLIRLNIVSLVRLSLAALAGFRTAGRGDLINLASIIAFAPMSTSATYSASKAFVLYFTRSLQLEYIDSPFRIQALLPGPVLTEFFTSQGLDDSIFPAQAYITAEQLVDSSLSGLDAGENTVIPSLEDMSLWDEMEKLRGRFMTETMSGKVASRYA